MIVVHFVLFSFFLLGIAPSISLSFKRPVACVCAILAGSFPLMALGAESLNIRSIVLSVMGALGPLALFFSAFLLFLIQGKSKMEFRACIICFIGSFLGFAGLIFIAVLADGLGG